MVDRCFFGVSAICCLFFLKRIYLSLSLVHTYAPPFDICMKISPICPTFVCVVFTPPSHQMIWPNPFFFCLFTSLPYCNRHLYNHLLLLHTSYIYSRCTICLVKNNNNNNKKIRIEKLTKRFQKNARANKSFFLFFCLFSCFRVAVQCLYFLLLNAHRQNTHTHTQREDSIFWLYVCNTCVCVCVLCLEIFVYPPAFRIYFDRHETKKDNWIIVHGLSQHTMSVFPKKKNKLVFFFYIYYI